MTESTRWREKYPDVQVLETAENQNNAEICHSLTMELLKRHTHLAAHSSELTQAIMNIASVNEENSASVEEVSALAASLMDI